MHVDSRKPKLGKFKLMLEVSTFRKNKVDLADYDYSKDIACRIMMARFSPKEVGVLEEILFSSLTIRLSKLGQSLDLDSAELVPILEKLSTTGLFKIIKDELHVDKEMRKYFELQLQRFEEDFKPDLDFLQGLLRQVPIHVLPNWYAISRTSNNIFDSIVEKYLATPQAFHRYLMELNLTDPVQRSIMKAAFRSPDFEVAAVDIIKEHKLSQEQFEEHLLYLELNFICSLYYKREGSRWKAIVAPFNEWGEYLRAVDHSQPPEIQDGRSIQRKKSSDFAFVEELSALLQMAQKQPLAIERTKEDLATLNEKAIKQLRKECPESSKADLHLLITKACALEFAKLSSEKFSLLPAGNEWLDMSIPERALALYRHPVHRLSREDLPEELLNEKTLREAEKSLQRVLKIGWVYLDEFLKGVTVPLTEAQAIQLKKVGRSWKYQLPHYSEEELDLFKAVICEWLFEVGITAVGTHEGSDCFCVTAFGRDLLGDE